VPVGDIGNSLHPSFIFFANTRYAWSASTCVGYVFSRFIHIFRYLSELRSFSAAYHWRFDDVCRHTTARFFPPSPVTPLTCLRQADLSSVISSEGADLGSSSSVELSADDALLAILEKKLERTGVEGTLFVDVDLDGVFLDDALFEDSVLEGLGLEGVSFDDELFEAVSFDDELFEGFAFGGSVFDRESFGGAVSGNAPIGVAAFEDEDLDGVGFVVEGFGDATFGGEGFGAETFGGAATFGDGGFAAAVAAFGGAALGMVTLGGGCVIWAAGGCAVNWPLAICRARSLTLRNILAVSDEICRDNLGAFHRFDGNRQP
jgi:uncharacterized protein YjbI with pentapeptide repeats